MKNGRILIAEDNPSNREALAELLMAGGYDVKAVADGKQALEAFEEDCYELVITDLNMPHMNGLELLKAIKEAKPASVVIIMTGYGTINSAVENMKWGAFDYITKPVKDNHVLLAVKRAVSYARLCNENVVLKDQIKEKYDFGKLIGYSDCMGKVFETIEKVSATDSTVIIYGESGTGKELVARAIHFNSDRLNRPMIAVNCGAIPDELLESELFGHEKGAFTGAIRSRIGRFELAQGGTIFLDEIGDMNPALQVKVLRVIQERQFERIGGVKTINIDVRIIAATNQNLEEAVAAKRFREDLFFRINVIPVHLPSLRERGEDIPILANHFLAKFNQLKKRKVEKITPAAMDIFMQYSWPGNVRELQNLIEMLVVMKGGSEIDVGDIPPKMLKRQEMEKTHDVNIESPKGVVNFNELVDNFEKELLLKALEKSGGVKNRAAKLLNLNRTTLVEKLKRFDIRNAGQD
ncbi:MAG TPA: sigma-54 dependent transcriptional regulator [Syntrophales bacterium]|nr:sigma-54 dependent transcriptional regulator [Syntrophales bacterium]